MSRQIKHFYEFGPFRVDTANRLLLRNGEPVTLKAKVIDTLLLLVERNGEVIEKDELMTCLWPDSFVEESNLTQNIYMLRKALGDGQYIETIPRRGYRFAADVRQWDENPSDLILIKERTRTSVSYEEEVDGLTARRGPQANTLAANDLGDTEFQRLTVLPKITTLSPQHRRRFWLVASLFAGLVIVIGVLVFWPRGSRMPFASVRLTRFTTTGNVINGAISPDGKYLAHVVDESGLKSIWLRQIATGKDLQVVPSQHVEWFYGLTFSHDGNYIYYVDQEMNHLGMLYQVPSLGGTPSKLMEDVDSPVTLSPDDKRLAFIRGSPGERSIVIANADGTAERKLYSTSQSGPYRLGGNWTIPPAWSSDGKTIAAAVGVNTPDEEYQTIWSFQTESGAARPLTSQHWQIVGRMEWLADGSGLLMTAAEQGASLEQQVWYVAYPDGAARKVTNDLSDYRDLSVTSDSKTLIAVQSERRANIWIAPAADTNHPTQLTFSNYDGLNGLSWTPDGKLVYTLQAGGEQNLWLVDPNSNSPTQLTAQAGVNRQPVVAPDGRYIVFVSNRTGRQHLWRIDADGKHPRELTRGLEDISPSFTPDSQWIVFRSIVAGSSRIFRISIDGGAPLSLSDFTCGDPIVSPDGTHIAFIYRSAPAALNQLAFIPFTGGEPRLINELPAHYGRFQWTRDSQNLAYSDKGVGVGNIWIQPLAGGAPKQLTRWRANPIFSFDWSRDGKWLAYSNGSMTSDVVLISDVGR
jgi:Tol biopolymer transport system component/DNA-binding winged helix-turn-helix (wHTH) protein